MEKATTELQTVYRAEYHQSVNRDSKVYSKNCRSGCKGGVEIVRLKIFLILDRGCLIDDD